MSVKVLQLLPQVQKCVGLGIKVTDDWPPAILPPTVSQLGWTSATMLWLSRGGCNDHNAYKYKWI